MKTANEWAEEFPIMVPNPYPIGHPNCMKFKQAYRRRYLRFIRDVQKDARKKS